MSDEFTNQERALNILASLGMAEYPALAMELAAELDAAERRGVRVDMADEQVQTAIAVLRAYADSTLRTDLCDELDEAIEAAFATKLKDEQVFDDLEEYHREIDGMRGN